MTDLPKCPYCGSRDHVVYEGGLLRFSYWYCHSCDEDFREKETTDAVDATDPTRSGTREDDRQR